MALKLYNPKTKTFVTYTPPDAVDATLVELLLLNILIELKGHTQQQQAATPGSETTDILLNDVVSVN